jgi:hypothetical protein
MRMKDPGRLSSAVNTPTTGQRRNTIPGKI